MYITFSYRQEVLLHVVCGVCAAFQNRVIVSGNPHRLWTCFEKMLEHNLNVVYHACVLWMQEPVKQFPVQYSLVAEQFGSFISVFFCLQDFCGEDVHTPKIFAVSKPSHNASVLVLREVKASLLEGFPHDTLVR